MIYNNKYYLNLLDKVKKKGIQKHLMHFSKGKTEAQRRSKNYLSSGPSDTAGSKSQASRFYLLSMEVLCTKTGEL